MVVYLYQGWIVQTKHFAPTEILESRALIEIRAATEADVVNVTNVLIRSVKEVGFSYYSPELTAEWIAEFSETETRKIITSEDYHVVVACLAMTMVGVGTLSIPGSKIEHCYVSGAGANCGVGSRILASLEAKAVALGMTAVELESSDGAQRFYERNGYHLAGEARLFRGKFVVYPYAKALV
jgi:predicted N-acetyltransferase YhbS